MSPKGKQIWLACILILLISNVLTLLYLFTSTQSPAMETGSTKSEVPLDSSFTAENGKSEPLAKVGTEFITKAELTERLLQQYGNKVLEEIINYKLVEAEAERLQISVNEELLEKELAHLRQDYLTEEEFEEALETQIGISKEELREEIGFYLLAEQLATHDIVITEQEIDEYYQEQRDAFYEPTRFHIHRILVPTEAEALAVLAEINQGSSFEAVASERSIDLVSATNGGDMGMLTADSFYLPYEVIRVAEELPLHQLSQPIPAEEGFSIIKVTERIAGGQRSLAEVREQIRRELALKEIDGLHNFIDRLREKAQVEIYLKK